MTTAQLYRASGLMLLVGTLLVAASSTLTGLMFPDTSVPEAVTNPTYVLASFVGLLGTALMLLGLPGLYARAAREGGLVWLVGVVLIALMAMLFGIGLGLIAAVVSPFLATQAPEVFRGGPPPSLLGVFIIGTVANVVGAVLMAIPMITRAIYPRWCGWLLVVAAVLTALSFFANGPSNSTSAVSEILNVVSSLPMFVAFGWLGYQLWSDRTIVAAVAGRSMAPQTA